MVYKIEKCAFKVLKDFKIGDLIPTHILHQNILKVLGFTKEITRANLIKNFEFMEYIKMKELGIWEIMKIPKPDKYDSWYSKSSD